MLRRCCARVRVSELEVTASPVVTAYRHEGMCRTMRRRVAEDGGTLVFPSILLDEYREAESPHLVLRVRALALFPEPVSGVAW